MQGSVAQLKEVAGERKLDEVRRDRRVIKRVLDGDQEAYAELYQLYERRVFASCLRVCGNPEDAADATQDAFATLLRRLPDLEFNNFSGYLFVVSRNAALEILRRKAKAVPTGELPELEDREATAAEEHPERALLVEDQRRMVNIANNRLAPRQREALILREISGLSYEEVAVEMGITARAVAQLIFRARISLKEAIRNLAAVSVRADTECRKAQPMLSRRVDGELSGTQRDWLEAHLHACESCRTNLEAVEEVGATFRSVAPWIAAPGAALLLGEDASAAAGAHYGGRTGNPFADFVGRLGRRAATWFGPEGLVAGAAAVAIVAVAGLISAEMLGAGDARRGPISPTAAASSTSVAGVPIASRQDSQAASRLVFEQTFLGITSPLGPTSTPTLGDVSRGSGSANIEAAEPGSDPAEPPVGSASSPDVGATASSGPTSSGEQGSSAGGGGNSSAETSATQTASRRPPRGGSSRSEGSGRERPRRRPPISAPTNPFAVATPPGPSMIVAPPSPGTGDGSPSGGGGSSEPVSRPTGGDSGSSSRPSDSTSRPTDSSTGRGDTPAR